MNTDPKTLEDKKKILELGKSLEGQKQLIELGKTIQAKKEIEEIRCQKENEIESYINELEFKFPEGLKKDNYQNSLRNIIFENKKFPERYLNSINTFNSSNFKDDILIQDFANLYYGYKLARMRKKNLEKEIESKNKDLADFKETYNDLAKECSDYEDENEKLLEKVVTFTHILIYISSLLIASNVALIIYVFLGPDRLISDIKVLLLSSLSMITGIFLLINNILNYIFGIPNITKFSIVSIAIISSYIYTKYKDKIDSTILNFKNKTIDFFEKYKITW